MEWEDNDFRMKKGENLKIQLANISLTYRKEKKSLRKKFLRSSKRSSTHVLTTPDPIPDPIIPSPQPSEWKWPMGQWKSEVPAYRKALQQTELVHMIPIIPPEKVRPP